jgi:hypothetical protein
VSAIVRRPDGRWAPGVSGNPDGRRAETGEVKLVRELTRQYTAEAVEALRTIMLDSTAQAMARVRAAETLLSRGWGQPSPEVDLDVADALADGPVVFRFAMGEVPLEIEGNVEDAEWADDAAPAALPRGV